MIKASHVFAAFVLWCPITPVLLAEEFIVSQLHSVKDCGLESQSFGMLFLLKTEDASCYSRVLYRIESLQ